MAATGQLRVAERRAVELIHAAGTGAVLALLSMPPEDRALDLADALYDAVTHSILTALPALAEDSTTAAAVAFRTVVPGSQGSPAVSAPSCLSGWTAPSRADPRAATIAGYG